MEIFNLSGNNTKRGLGAHHKIKSSLSNQGKIPDLSTYMKICEWLEVSPEEFSIGSQNKEKTHKEEIYFHLRADQSLSQDVAEALTKMIELAYNNSDELRKK